MRFLLARLYAPGFLFGFLALAITLQLPSTAWAEAHPTGRCAAAARRYGAT